MPRTREGSDKENNALCKFNNAVETLSREQGVSTNGGQSYRCKFEVVTRDDKIGHIRN